MSIIVAADTGGTFTDLAAFDREIADKPLSRMILGESVVFWRGRDGKVVAMEDRCPHRRAPP